MTWVEALTAVAALGDADGTGAWRLPTRRELFSLVSHQYVNPALPGGHPFSGVFNGYYWTGTPCARLASQVWYVHLGGGKVYRGMTHGSYLVWPVTGPDYGAVPAAGRFRTDGDTIRDRATGLIWHAGHRLPAAPVSWPKAFDAVRRLDAEGETGATGWRLPTIRELESLVDDTRHGPALAAGVALADSAAQGYWSSTTSIYEPRYAWVLYPRDGAIGVGFKPQADFHVTAVCGGPPPG